MFDVFDVFDVLVGILMMITHWQFSRTRIIYTPPPAPTIVQTITYNSGYWHTHSQSHVYINNQGTVYEYELDSHTGQEQYNYGYDYTAGEWIDIGSGIPSTITKKWKHNNHLWCWVGLRNFHRPILYLLTLVSDI